MDGDAYLINKEYKTENGVRSIEETQTLILVEVKSVSRLEYFSAGQNGLASSYVLVTNSANYDGQNEVIFEGKRYSIYRTFRDPENDDIELYLQLVQGDYKCVIKTLIGSQMNERGFRTYTYNSYNSYCNIKSASESQIYEASTSGIRVELVAIVRVSDYLSGVVMVEGRKVKPSHIVVDGTEYEIHKAQINDTTVELVLMETVNG